MEHGEISSSRLTTERVVTNDSILGVHIVRIWFKKLWRIGSGSQRTKRFYRGNIHLIWKRMRGIPVSFFQAGTIINWNDR